VRLSASSDSALAQGESTLAREAAATTQAGHVPSASQSHSLDSKAGPSQEQQQQLLPPECTTECSPVGLKAGRLLAVGRLTCIPLAQSRGGRTNGENGNGGEENGYGGGEKRGNWIGGEAGRREESGALGNRKEGNGEEEVKRRMGEGTDEYEGSRACSCSNFPHFDSPHFDSPRFESPHFDSPRFNRLPIHKFIGLRFLSACPHRVVAVFVSSPSTAQVLLLAGVCACRCFSFTLLTPTSLLCLVPPNFFHSLSPLLSLVLSHWFSRSSASLPPFCQVDSKTASPLPSQQPAGSLGSVGASPAASTGGSSGRLENTHFVNVFPFLSSLSLSSPLTTYTEEYQP
ncbi:unnamed protein product, partial [Closterium sp. NIES-54]